MRRPQIYVSAVDEAEQGLVAVVMDISTARPRLLGYSRPGENGLTVHGLQALYRGLPKDLPWVWTCAREQYSLVEMEKPPLPEKELGEGIRWALDARIDFPTQEAVIVWMDMPQPAESDRPEHVYVVAAPQSSIDNIQQTFEQAALPLQVIDVRETAQRNIAALLEQDDECLALMSFEPQGVLLTFTWRGALYLDRFFVQPLQEIEQADEAGRQRILVRIANEYNRSLDFLYRQFNFLKVSRLMLGPLSLEIDMISVMSTRLPHPVQKLDLASVLDLGEQISAKEFAQGVVQAQLWSAIGAGLRYDGSSS